MSTEEKFNAAINVIRSLPKNGSYQPSKELLLRFYAYYKQGTIGRNNQPKPSFWDVVNRAKWQAWESLGDMPKEQAMQEYVNELKKIVETMAYTNPVADFVSSLDSFYESVSINDLEIAVGPIERDKADTSSIVSINERQSIGETDIDEECFHDVMETTGELKRSTVHQVNQYLRSTDEYDNDMMSNNLIPVSQQNGICETQLHFSNQLMEEFQLQIKNTVSSLKHDLDLITNRVAQIELKLNEMKSRESRVSSRRDSYHKLYQMIFLISWPIVVQLIFIWFQKKKRQQVVNKLL